MMMMVLDSLHVVITCKPVGGNERRKRSVNVSKCVTELFGSMVTGFPVGMGYLCCDEDATRKEKN